MHGFQTEGAESSHFFGKAFKQITYPTRWQHLLIGLQNVKTGLYPQHFMSGICRICLSFISCEHELPWRQRHVNTLACPCRHMPTIFGNPGRIFLVSLRHAAFDAGCSKRTLAGMCSAVSHNRSLMHCRYQIREVICMITHQSERFVAVVSPSRLSSQAIRGSHHFAVTTTSINDTENKRDPQGPRTGTKRANFKIPSLLSKTSKWSIKVPYSKVQMGKTQQGFGKQGAFNRSNKTHQKKREKRV